MADTLYIEIVSPTGRVYRGTATGIRIPGVEGSFEVRFNHAPLIAAFEIGVIDVTVSPAEQLGFATSGGFIEVLNNTVTVLAETAEPVAGIDVERARSAEERAVARLAEVGGDERRKAESDLERARNRLRAAMGAVGLG